MNDMSAVITPKSDQINADDLLAGPRTIRITEVNIRPGTEQPVSIFFDGDEGKPWKCCKSMSRVLVAAWGPDAKLYVGRSVTIYRDPAVKWGGMEVGGIRISHMSHIERDMVLALTATKGKKSPHTVRPLKVETTKQSEAPRRTITQFLDDLERNLTEALASPDASIAVNAILSHPDVKLAEGKFTNGAKGRLEKIIQTAIAQMAADPDGDFPIENDPTSDPDTLQTQDFLTQISACVTEAEVKAFTANTAVRRRMAGWEKTRPELHKLVDDAAAAAIERARKDMDGG